MSTSIGLEFEGFEKDDQPSEILKLGSYCQQVLFGKACLSSNSTCCNTGAAEKWKKGSSIRGRGRQSMKRFFRILTQFNCSISSSRNLRSVSESIRRKLID